VRAVAESRAEYATTPTAELPKDEIHRLIRDLESQMKEAARQLEFEKAALLRDQIIELKRTLAVGDGETVPRELAHPPRARAR
jgi:excinuclease ABC subunit B